MVWIDISCICNIQIKKKKKMQKHAQMNKTPEISIVRIEMSIGLYLRCFVVVLISVISNESISKHFY